MSTSHRMNGLRTLVVGCLLAATPALAGSPTSSSSCPAPCLKPPKYALFRKETGTLDATSKIEDVLGTLSRGTAHTVVRLDATVFVLGNLSIGSLFMSPTINGRSFDPVYAGVVFPCVSGQSFCTVTGTLWFDVDELEAKHPGEYVGQPLSIKVGAAGLSGTAVGADYVATFSAQVVKKK